MSSVTPYIYWPVCFRHSLPVCTFGSLSQLNFVSLCTNVHTMHWGTFVLRIKITHSDTCTSWQFASCIWLRQCVSSQIFCIYLFVSFSWRKKISGKLRWLGIRTESHVSRWAFILDDSIMIFGSKLSIKCTFVLCLCRTRSISLMFSYTDIHVMINAQNCLAGYCRIYAMHILTSAPTWLCT